ncbi:MAG: esterase-like activity of phytase family protein [Phycisphaerales bacterium]
MNARITIVVATWMACAGLACAQPLAMTFRNVAGLGGTAMDQFGVTFTVTGMSGISRDGGDFWAVMDNSNKLVRLAIVVSANGTITSAAIVGGLSLADSWDFEGIVATGRGTVLLSEETTPGVHEYSLATGARVRTLAIPPVFAAIRPNNGFESLALGAAGAWTANEQALTVDGGIATPSAGTVVRLLRFTPALAAAEQFAYVSEPLHGSVISGSTGGLSDVLMLPDGRLVALERSLAGSISGLFRSRVYEVAVAGATDVSGIAGLIGATYTPVGKTLLYSGDQQNMEGLGLGEALGPGRWSVIGIVDDGDPISVNRVVGFEVAGVGECVANCDASTTVPALNVNDFICFGNLFAGGESRANCDGSTAVPVLNVNDFVCFITAFAAGCS